MYCNSKFILLFLFSLVFVVRGFAEEVTTEKSVTYRQEHCRFSVTLPEDWKQVIHENDAKLGGYTRGLYRFIPEPGKEPSAAEWAHTSDPLTYFIVQMHPRVPGFGFGVYYDFQLRNFLEQDYTIIEKQTFSLPGKPTKSWMLSTPYNLECYMICTASNDCYYTLLFYTRNVNPELRAQYEKIAQTITFIEKS